MRAHCFCAEEGGRNEGTDQRGTLSGVLYYEHLPGPRERENIPAKKTLILERDCHAERNKRLSSRAIRSEANARHPERRKSLSSRAKRGILVSASRTSRRPRRQVPRSLAALGMT